MNGTLVWIVVGTLGLFWLYVAARVVTRGVLRTLRDHERRPHNGET